MKTNAILVAGMIAATALAAAGWMLFGEAARESPAPESAHELSPADEPAPLLSAPPPPSAPLPIPVPSPAAPLGGVTPAASPTGNISAPARQPAATPPKLKRVLQNPEARVALSLVGVDPAAEEYWLGAIFDENLPDKEREDLIEDLNEEGLTDKKRPGPEDLPLILKRIALIEEITPRADEFMLRHLREAHKDLLNLAHVSQGGGQPVK